jgi:hypothetical protein
MNLSKMFRESMHDRWYAREMIRALQRGPGVMSLYFSLAIGLLCSALSFEFLKDMETASIVVSSALILLSASFIICDFWFYAWNRRVLLLWWAARRCEKRMKWLHVESIPVFVAFGLGLRQARPRWLVPDNVE